MLIPGHTRIEWNDGQSCLKSSKISSHEIEEFETFQINTYFLGDDDDDEDNNNNTRHKPALIPKRVQCAHQLVGEG